MAQMIVRSIPDEALAKFKDRAKQEGLSAEAMARRLIVQEAQQPAKISFDEAVRRIDELRALTPQPLDSSVPILRSFRDGDDAGR
ncbi:MAG: hypothetical protein QM698_05600 [Micropepsaceae bacterium]